MYTWKLCNFITESHPDKVNKNIFRKKRSALILRGSQETLSRRMVSVPGRPSLERSLWPLPLLIPLPSLPSPHLGPCSGGFLFEVKRSHRVPSSPVSTTRGLAGSFCPGAAELPGQPPPAPEEQRSSTAAVGETVRQWRKASCPVRAGSRSYFCCPEESRKEIHCFWWLTFFVLSCRFYIFYFLKTYFYQKKIKCCHKTFNPIRKGNDI